MKESRFDSIVVLILACFVIGGTGCHLIFPFERVPVDPEDPYLCTAQIYRALPGSSEEFTEEWELYTWASSASSANSDCTARIGQYISEYMAPGLGWSYRNLGAVVVSKEDAIDCTLPYPAPTYGAPFGAELVWNTPPATQASTYINLVDKDGVTRTATPSVAYAYADLAEKTGLPDGSTYVLGKRHIRMSDLYLELAVPFQLGSDLTVNKLYIQSVGTVIGEHTGGTLYKVYPGDAKFFFYAQGVLSGESGTTSLCFVNDVTANITEYQGAPNAFFTLSLNLFVDMGTAADMQLQVSLSKPTSTFSFNTHQPYVYLVDKTLTSPVDLIPDIAFDHDSNLDEYLWFEDFEGTGEVFLGKGNPLNGVTLAQGVHEITVVAYDTYGAYNSDTMTLTIIPSLPTEVWVDDDYTSSSAGGHTWGVDAFDNIGDGISAVASPGKVHVAAGDYSESVVMRGGVQVLGAGSAVTVIDGNADGPVVQARWISTPARIAGFTITNGSHVWGGGIHIHESTGMITISNCEITENAGTYGGGLYSNNSSVEVTNSTFWQNTAQDGAGVFFLDTTASSTMVNCSLTDNVAGNYGGGIYNHNSSPTLTNTILWGNTATGGVGNEIYEDATSAATVSYCDVEGGYSGLANIDYDPLFRDPDNGDLRLRQGSRCIDAGTNAAVPVWLTHDIEGHTRKIDGDLDGSTIVDMGVDEVPFYSPSEVWVDDDWAGTDAGTLVEQHVFGYNAFDVIQDGIDAVSSPGKVHVAQGYYAENILLKSGVEVWGAEAFFTTIDGQGSGSVVSAFDVDSTTILHGFTLTNGWSIGWGGGMYNSNSDVIVSNCIFEQNTAGFGGAMANDGSSPTVINTTFWNNTGTNDADSLGNDSGSSPTVTNSILWGTSRNQISGGSPTVTYSNIEGGYPGIGNIEFPPMFSENLHLLFGSPCIDAGDNSAVPTWLVTDADLEPRITDGNGSGTAIVDMGADEAPYIPPCFDTDGDGYGNPSNSLCTYPEPDCDDTRSDVHPGATELCDGIDNDCDPGSPDGMSEAWLHLPCDGTDSDLCEEGTYACVAGSQECSDTSGDDVETCDGTDNDCDGDTDEGLSTDADSDGHFLPGSCLTPDDDCDDGNADVYPGAPEILDGIDNQCPGDPGYGEVDEGLDFGLVSPANESHPSSPPSFSWKPGPYNAFLFYCIFYYDLGVVSVHYPAYFWVAVSGFPMPASWWNQLDAGQPNYWTVLGYNTGTGDLEQSEVWSFTK